MPSFLTKSQIYDIINRELPEGLFSYSPDPSKFYITSELDSYAFTIAATYDTMKSIYDNEFISTADEKISDFEIMYFGTTSVGLTLEEKRNRIFAKIRSQAFVSLWDILTYVASYVPEGTYVQILENGKFGGFDSWSLSQSELDLNTYLGNVSPQQLYGEDADLVWTGDWQQGDPIPTGVYCDPNITQASVLGMRDMAYSYEIRIFGYELTGEVLVNFQKDLELIQPVRSKYYIAQNLVLADYYLTVDVDNVGQFTQATLPFGIKIAVDCIAVDPTQTVTGYKGRTYST